MDDQRSQPPPSQRRRLLVVASLCALLLAGCVVNPVPTPGESGAMAGVGGQGAPGASDSAAWDAGNFGGSEDNAGVDAASPAAGVTPTDADGDANGDDASSPAGDDGASPADAGTRGK